LLSFVLYIIYYYIPGITLFILWSSELWIQSLTGYLHYTLLNSFLIWDYNIWINSSLETNLLFIYCYYIICQRLTTPNIMLTLLHWVSDHYSILPNALLMLLLFRKCIFCFSNYRMIFYCSHAYVLMFCRMWLLI